MASVFTAVFLLIVMAGMTTVHADDGALYVGGQLITEENPTVDIEHASWHGGKATYDFTTHTLTITPSEEKKKSGIKLVATTAGNTEEDDGIDQGALYSAIYAKNIPDLTIKLDKTLCELSNPGETIRTGRYAGIFVDGGSLTIDGEGVFSISPSGIKRRSIYASGNITIGEKVAICCGNVSSDNTQQIGIEAGGSVTVKKGASVYCSLSASSGTNVKAQKAIVCGGTLTVSGAPDLPDYYSTEYPNDFKSKGTVYAQTDKSNIGTAATIQAATLVASGDSTLNVIEAKILAEDGSSVGIDADVTLSDSARIKYSMSEYGEDKCESIGIKGSVTASGSSKIIYDGTNGSPYTGISLESSDSFAVTGKVELVISGRDKAITGMSDDDLAGLASLGAFVSADATSANAEPWDGVTSLDSYKYVAIPGSYPVWIGDKAPTPSTKDDVLADGGSVKYDPSTRTLTLENAVIETAPDGTDAGGIVSHLDDLTIVLKGDNTISNTTAASGSTVGIKSGINGGNDLKITGDGKLTIDIDGKGSEKEPKGILCRKLDVDSAELAINVHGGAAFDTAVYYGTRERIVQLAGIYASDNITLNDAKLNITMKAPKNRVVSGIFHTEQKHITITGASDVTIDIHSEGSDAAVAVTGITGYNINGDPMYNRGVDIVEVSGTSKLTIDTTGAAAGQYNGGLYGDIKLKDSSEFEVSSGKARYMSFGAGCYPSQASSGLSYFGYFKVYDDAKAKATSGEAENYSFAALCSIETKGNAKVEAIAGTAGVKSSGTGDSQGIEAFGNSEVKVIGDHYGTDGIVEVNDSAVVTAQGGTKAIHGVWGAGANQLPFNPSELGVLVNLTGYTGYTADESGKVSSPAVEVNTEAKSTGTSSWNGTDALGGDDSTFKYIRIPAHTHEWDAGVVTKEPTQTETGERVYTCTICGETRYETIPMLPINYVKITLDAGEGHDAVAKKIEEEINKTAADGYKAVADGTRVSLYFEEGTTIHEAEDKLKEAVNATEVIVDNGQRWAERIGLKTTREYADFDEYWNAERASDSTKGNDPVTQDTVLYVNWNDPVSSSTLTVKAPVAGETVSLDEDNLPDKEPEVTLSSEDPSIQIVGLAIWREVGQEKGFFTGTFVSGTEYEASIWILPEFGYYITSDYKATVNGEEVAELYVNNQETYVVITSLQKAYKLDNTFTAKGKNVKKKAKTLKKKAVKISRKKAITVKNAKGKVTYKKVKVLKGKKKVSKKIAKKFVINSKTGKITLKKGIKKGTYKFKIKVRDAGTKMYKAKAKTVTVKVSVK